MHPILTEDAVAAALRVAADAADRIEAGVNSSTVVDPLRAVGPRSTPTHVLSPSMPTAPVPPSWSWALLHEPVSPEFALFYSAGHEFPDLAVLFSGHGDTTWATIHRTPLVLDSLARRFDELAAGASRLEPSGFGDPEEQAALVTVRESTRPAPDADEPPDATPQIVAPAELYRLILSEHFSDIESDAAAADDSSSWLLTPHQRHACERARAILDAYGGVIIADAVGLGKTYIGLQLLRDVAGAGGRAIVVVPAVLRRDWRERLAECGAESRSRRTLESSPHRSRNLELWTREVARDPIEVITTESMGRRSFRIAEHRGADLILVDEAHHFRNPSTRRYRSLAAIARGVRLVLLTATPINNSLRDLQSLIELFAAPGAFRHLGVPDYRGVLSAGRREDVAIRAILSACVIRRTRRFLRHHYGEIELRSDQSEAPPRLRFPRRRPPVPVHYDLQAVYGPQIADLEAWLDRLQYPSPRVDHGEPESIGADLMKIVLLKRLESSVEAFRRTVNQQLAWCRAALHALRRGRLMTRPDYRASFRGPRDDPGSQLSLVELMLPAAPAGAATLAAFRAALERDEALLIRLRSSLRPGSHTDQKLERLLQLIDGDLAGRKVLLFTEFRDTARYLHWALAVRPYIGLIHSGAAMLGREAAGRRAVIDRFAPLANRRPKPPERERVDLLIATDVASEGLNLQDASVVISYDLPWNPVRLMQRMGRIDRLGSPNEFVELFHFVPAAQIDRLLGLMGRLRAKIRTISYTLGLDDPVLALGDDVEISSATRRAGSPGAWEDLEDRIEGPLDPEERAYLDYVELGAGSAGRRRAPCVAGCEADDGVRAVSYWRLTTPSGTRGVWLVYRRPDGRVVEDPDSAVRVLRSCRPATRTVPDPGLIRPIRAAFRDYARGLARRIEATHVAGDALRPHLPQYRLAAWLARGLRSRIDRTRLEAAVELDTLLDRLARRYTAAAERALSELLERRPVRPEPEFLIQLDRTLRRLRSTAHGASGPTQAVEIGTLLVDPQS